MKTHLLLPHTVGLFENNITGCRAAGQVKGTTLIHYLTGAKFALSTNPTCKGCIHALARQD